MSATCFSPRASAIRLAPHRIVVERVDWTGRIIPVSRGVNIRGYLPIGKGRPSVAFESLLEKRTIARLATYPEAVAIRAQPLTIYYRADGVAHCYTPDLLITLSCVPPDLEARGFEVRTLVEVKPAARLSVERDRLERHFRAATLARVAPLVLITDEDLESWEACRVG